MPVYSNGVPTEIDIRKIRQTYPDSSLNVGDQILYQDIEQLIQCKRDSYRFRTVTYRWRRLVENATNKIIGTNRSIGFVVLSEEEKLSLSGDKLRSAGNLAKRSYVVTARIQTNQLSPEQRKELNFIVKKTSAVLAAARLRPTAKLPTI